jgi:hypothetical protein
MWSDRYYYLNIVYDLSLSAATGTQDLTAFLNKQPELIQVADFKFRNAPEFLTFIEMQLLNAHDYNRWSDHDVSPKTTNMIAIVCAKNEGDNYEPVKDLLTRIARFLGWELIDEYTDDDIENYIVWKPSTGSGHPFSG